MVGITLLQVLFTLFQEGTNWFNIKENKYGQELLCLQVSHFAPNMCEYPSAKLHCKNICQMKDGNAGMLRCGKREIDSHRRQKRIVGGSLSKPGEWPWRVSLMLRDKQMCAGSILSEYFILTAWHCFDEHLASTKANDWLVIAGERTLLQDDKTKEAVKVRKIIKHKDGVIREYNLTTKRYAVIEDDIAIVALEQPIKIDSVHKSAVCLPEETRRISAYQTCFISGWGHMKFRGNISRNLRHAAVPIVPTDVCNTEYTYNNTIDGKKVICAGFQKGGIDACYFDSGGSLDYEMEGKWYTAGIISSGFECARPNAYGLYTNIYNYKEWIIDTILTQVD